MSTHLFQALTLGLLLIVVVVLLVVVSMLGKVRAALEGRSAARTPGADDDANAVDAQEIEPASARATFDAFEAEESKPEALAPNAEELAASRAEEVETIDVSMAEAEDVDSDRPFERAGRWYFRRSGELLVYEEGTGEWIPATAAVEAQSPARTAQAGQDTGVQAQAEEVAAATEPSPETAVVDEPAAVAPAPVEQTDDATERTPSTSFGGQPVAVVEDPGALEDSELSPGPGDAASDFEVAEAREADALAQQAESFWKCPSCGAVNGSTASSCRMCFTPRP